jgi:hypothetical protein
MKKRYSGMRTPLKRKSESFRPGQKKKQKLLTKEEKKRHKFISLRQYMRYLYTPHLKSAILNNTILMLTTLLFIQY